MGAKNLLFVVILVLLIPITSASYITLQNDITKTYSEGRAEITINTTNHGDETAYGIYHEISTDEGIIESERYDLGVESSTVFSLDAEVAEDMPLFIKTHYEDANSYPFSSISIVGKSNIKGIDAEAEESSISKRGHITFNIRNLDDDEKDVRLTLVVPEEITCRDNQKEITLSDKKDVSFTLRNNGALQGSSYEVFLKIEYKQEGKTNYGYTSGIVNIEKKNSLMFFVYLSIAALACISALAYIFRKSPKRMWLVIDIFVFAFIFLFIFSYFAPQYMLSKTTTTGGDTASHYLTAQYMKDYLLPHLKLTGWLQGNYAGMPLLHFYFPLPFFLAAIFGYIFPLEITFKFATILGTLLLPIAAYMMFRAMKIKFPGPAIAAILTLPFLFHEANSMWGGNIPSTLAGEFSYSLGLALSLVFLGMMYKGVHEKKYLILNISLMFLIGLSHVYALLFAGLGSLFLLLTKKDFKERVKYLAKVYLTSFLLLGFWLIPLVSGLGFTTSYADRWYIDSISTVFPLVITIFFPLILIYISYLVFEKKIRKDTRPYYLMFSIVLSAALYLSAYYLGLVDIRFIPFIQLMLLMLAAYSASLVLEKINDYAKYAAVVILVVLTLGLVYSNVSYIDQWIPWNYNGFEKKGTWETYHDINTYLNGTENDPRVVYEHSDTHNKFGSSRAFESLPLFAGRSTLEGLYMQSSPNAPFIFYIQSLVSKQKSCPFPNFGCAETDLERAFPRLQMYNVDQYIAVSEDAKNLADMNDNFVLVKSVDGYNIYDVKIKEGYVYVPEYRPVVLETGNPQRMAYLWFINDSLIDVPLVFRHFSEEEHQHLYGLEGIEKVKIDNDCTINEKIEEERITFDTDCVGKPHIIRISYFPKWKVSGAKEVYPVSPYFMMVYPDQEHVVLYYGKNTADYLGIIFTISGITLVLVFALSRKRKGWKNIGEKIDVIFDAIAKNFLLVIILLFVVFILFFASSALSGKQDEKLRLTMEIAKETGSYSVCEHVGKYSDECFIAVGKKTYDHNLCAVRVSDENKDICYKEIAIAWNNNSLCGQIKDNGIKKECDDALI